FWRNAQSVVLYGDLHHPTPRARGTHRLLPALRVDGRESDTLCHDLNWGARWGVLDGIGEQVREDLTQAHRFGPDLQALRDAHVQLALVWKPLLKLLLEPLLELVRASVAWIDKL